MERGGHSNHLFVACATLSSLLKKLLRDPIAASRARSFLAYLSELWLRHNVRLAYVSLNRNSFSRRSLRGSLHSGRSLRFSQQNS